MKAFDSLHPALQHHIVNTFGWKTLRPLQEKSVQPIVAGRDVLLLAPTAGGKTEAAIFPLLSRALSESWSGLSVLYVCPIKALLNSLHERLTLYSELVGLHCALWHGDTPQRERRAILAEPPQILLITPESLEVMLVSARVDHNALFREMRAVVIDEIHAFAGDDRGWHLLAVLQRVEKLAVYRPQRLGLSATVGNPHNILDWMAPASLGTAQIIAPKAVDAKDAEVQLDYVGNLDNAAIVISRMHRGEKRLVFCDSRARVEKLASLLHELGVTAFVSHSSLSVDERKRAEAAFSQAANCVIVATSTFELGIDVGDLDRIIQIDAPGSVSSFLQRLGRTGRRKAARKNCRFLATGDDALVQATAIIHLWEMGVVEPVVPPPKPAHILAQQVMALALQEKGIGADRWSEWIGEVPGFKAIPLSEQQDVVKHMIQSAVLTDDQGILWFDREGERRFGYRNFLELCSTFTSPPLFKVMHGRKELGFVHESSFLRPDGEPCVLLLSGWNWEVTYLDWGKKIAQVKPVTYRGRSRWLGKGVFLSPELAQAMRRVLAGGNSSPGWSRRAYDRLTEISSEYTWVNDQATFLVRSGDGYRWWTFAGTAANMALANAIRNLLAVEAQAEGLFIRLSDPLTPEHLVSLQNTCRTDDACFMLGDSLETCLKQLKFSTCLPLSMQQAIYKSRFIDIDGARATINLPVRRVNVVK